VILEIMKIAGRLYNGAGTNRRRVNSERLFSARYTEPMTFA
jgi:hypothetical protein